MTCRLAVDVRGQAFKISITIPEDRVVRFPVEVPSGPAELIVLREPDSSEPSVTLREFLAYVENARTRLKSTLTKEEIDRYIG